VDGPSASTHGTNVALKRRFDAIDGIKVQLQTLVDASKHRHRVKVHTRMKTAPKTCSRCSEVNTALGGVRAFRCSVCHLRLDRDINAILIKNREMLVL
jgi:hypothetical protein